MQQWFYNSCQKGWLEYTPYMHWSWVTLLGCQRRVIPKNTSMDKCFDQWCFLLRITSRYQLKLENFQGEKNSLLIKNKKKFYVASLRSQLNIELLAQPRASHYLICYMCFTDEAIHSLESSIRYMKIIEASLKPFLGSANFVTWVSEKYFQNIRFTM